MAIRKRVKRRRGNTEQDADVTLPTVPVFSYPITDALAKVVVNAWVDPGDLLKRDRRGNPTNAAATEATNKINEALKAGGPPPTAGVLKRAVIISEEEHDDDYTMQEPEEVVFVLPNKDRVTLPNPMPNPIPPHILETAKVLMACTPNGI